MLFTRTPSGLAAKPLFVYVRVHTDISYRPSRQDSQQKKRTEIGLDWRLKRISGPVYSA